MEHPILVTGGTGNLGRNVVAQLRWEGTAVRALSRHAGGTTDGVDYAIGDLQTGQGVAEAMRDVEVVIHCAGTRGGAGDEAMAATLVRAAAGAGVRHIVNISVVGADRVTVKSRADRSMFGYFAAKLASERTIAESGIPWSTLRATQFHDLILDTVRALAKLPVVPVPSHVRFQPIDASEVAARMVELARGEPAGLVPDVAGPRAYALKELVRDYLHAAGMHRVLVPMHIPGAAARAVRAGAVLAPDRAVGRRTWEDFLGDELGPRAQRRPAWDSLA